MRTPLEDPSPEVLEEGCYYLSELGLSIEQVAKSFEIEVDAARTFRDAYARKLEAKQVVPGDVDRAFWEDVKKEAEGDVKLTFVSDKGFHHAWKSELSKLDGSTLMSIYESSRDFLSTDMNQRFLDFPAPKGFDPLALDREVRRAVQVVGELMDRKWRESKVGKNGSENP